MRIYFLLSGGQRMVRVSLYQLYLKYLQFLITNMPKWHNLGWPYLVPLTAKKRTTLSQAESLNGIERVLLLGVKSA